VDDLIDISQIVRGALQLNIQRIDLAVILRQAAEIVEPTIQSKAITLMLKVASDVPLIEGDPHRLLQVFWNLLSNAAKFTPSGGSIEIGARRDGGVVCVEVRDTGCGIDPAFLPFVFDRFRQGDASSTRGHGGLGLGLAIVRELVHRHGGTVDVASSGPGQGSRFTVCLPLVVCEADSHLALTS
jgi:signal transduction histidine kinase